MTHSETHFHRPYEFIPERWVDPDCTDDLSASQPFELGSRVCIGRKFVHALWFSGFVFELTLLYLFSLALMEMRMTLAKLFWTYDVELVDHSLDWLRDNKLYFLWEKPELKIRVRRRAGV